MTPPLIPPLEAAVMLANGAMSRVCHNLDLDHKPVVKLATGNGRMVWLLSELDPREPTQAFGLCDLGVGYPELGWVDLVELANTEALLGETAAVRHDPGWAPRGTLSDYERWSKQAREIVA